MNSPNSKEALGIVGKGSGAGKRLLEISGMSARDYLNSFERLNLLDSRWWSVTQAKVSAARMYWKFAGRVTIVLGREVWTCLDLPLTDWLHNWRDDRFEFWLMPHPSGKNLWYNSSSNLESARKLLRRLASGRSS